MADSTLLTFTGDRMFWMVNGVAVLGFEIVKESASGDCCATCSNLGESQKANLNERNANENGGEERKNRSIESDRIVRGPVPPGAKYVVGLIFIAGLIGTVMMGWLMGVFRSSPNFVDEE